jgi:hypothetical protein
MGKHAVTARCVSVDQPCDSAAIMYMAATVDVENRSGIWKGQVNEIQGPLAWVIPPGLVVAINTRQSVS